MKLLRLLLPLLLLTLSGCLMMEPHPGIVVGNPEVDDETAETGDEELPEITQLPPPAVEDPPSSPTRPETPPSENDQNPIDPIVKEPVEPEAAEHEEIPGMDRVGETETPTPKKANAESPDATLTHRVRKKRPQGI